MSNPSRVRHDLRWALCVGLGLVGTAHAGARFRLVQWPAAAPAPAFTLRDIDNHTRTLKDYAGNVTIVFFGFTHCPDICPGELITLSHVFQRLGAASASVRVVFVTLDAQRDTPAIVESYAAAFNPNFIGLSGSTAAVNAAAASFSVQFARIPLANGDYTFSHSTGSYVLDRHGRLRLVATLATPVEDWVHDLSILIRE